MCKRTTWRTRAVKAAVIVWLAMGSLPVFAQSKTPIYVFTATDPSGFVDAATTARLKLVAETQKAVAQSKTLTLAETPEQALLTLEIQGTSVTDERDNLASLANSLDRLNGGLAAAGANRNESKKVTYRHATLRVGDYSTELVLRYGAKAFVHVTEDWVKTNQARLGAK